ncbi:MAG: T9SS type A sorting domain-containing protein [Bacteroidetes bacterium]|nr:T9SS type A sorting domain-containing protein [Bacteroidota bacterium]
MKKTLLVVSAAFLCISSMNAQDQKRTRQCATHEHNAELMSKDSQFKANYDRLNAEAAEVDANPSLNKVTNIVTIPVVAHVLWKTQTQNIVDAKIFAQIEQLNQDYSATNTDTNLVPAVFKPLIANSQIQFCLAKRDPQGNPHTGINRVQTTKSSFGSSNDAKFTSQGGVDAWPRDSYLNLWICNLGGGLLGYAQFPGGAANTDGVVVLYSSIGSIANPGSFSPYNLGRTTTHEVGHWLNLRHIWGDSNCGNDFVSDTPVQQSSNFGCPSFPKITCSNGPNGEMFMNYMDYVDDDCMNMFSIGQGARMNLLFNPNNGTRKALLTSLGCVPASINEISDAAEIMSIFPNPSSGIFNLSFMAGNIRQFEVEVHNLVGQKVFSTQEKAFTNSNYQLDLSSLKKGVYNMLFSTEGKIYTKRISIQ